MKLSQNNLIKICYLCFYLIMALANPSVYAKSFNNRIGMSIGGINWNKAELNLSFDNQGFLPQRRWTIGGELSILGYGFIISPRALYWEYPNLVGFYGGPKISIGTMNNSNKSFVAGIGGEGGYLYRFPLKFDIGGGLEFEATNDGLWMGIKITAGYLIP